METKPITREIKHICVFSGSKTGKNPQYAEQSEKFAKEMVKKKIGLVYGGGTIGLMGVMANTIHNAGGEVIGIIPASLAPKEVSGEGIGTQIVVQSMHDRKLMMYQKSDAFVALPGGVGTLEELLEVLTWLQLGIHNKPIALLNIAGYYDPLAKQLETAVSEGFIDEDFCKDALILHSDPNSLLEVLSSHQTPQSKIHWLKESEL